MGFYNKSGFIPASDEFDVPGVGPYYNMLVDLN